MPQGLRVVEQVAGLTAIFEQTAEAVMTAQSSLDGELGLDYLSRCEAAGQPMLYSIPRVGVTLEFGLSIDEQRRVLLILPRGGRQQRHTHRLTFSLVAVPDPPPVAADAALPFFLTEPHFLLPPQAERVVYWDFIEALRDSRRWLSLVPSRRPLTQQDVDDEINRLADAYAKDEDPDAPAGERERGLVYFRLDTAPVSYLIARVTKKSKNDSLFVFTPEPAPGARAVEIYSIEDDDTPRLSYRPLHLLGLTVRHWLEGATPLSVRLEGGLPSGLGLESLRDFAANMREGYLLGTAALAQKWADPAVTSLYELRDVGAELTYSVTYEESAGEEGLINPRFNFEYRDASDYKLIQSRAVIRALREGDAARFEVELAAPEFALSGVARALFLDYFRGGPQTVRRIVRQIRERVERLGESADSYEGFIRNSAYWRSVVVLLSYRGDKPKEQFLVIWPGTNRAGQERSFVFTCNRKDDELNLTNLILSVEQGLDHVQLDTATGAEQPDEDRDLSEEQYQVFHNFFHAVRIWRARVSRA